MSTVTSGNVSSQGMKPLDTAEKTEDWHLNYNRFVSLQYNPIIPLDWADNGVTNGAGNGASYSTIRWADRIMKTVLYLYGVQDTTGIQYMAIDQMNNPDPVKFVNDQTIYELAKHMTGTMVKKMMNLANTVYAKNVQSEALEDRDMIYNVYKMKLEMAEAFKFLEESGISFNPDEGIPDEVLDKTERLSEESIPDAASSYFTAYIKDWLWKTDWESWTKKAFSYMLPAYFCRAELIVKNGKIEINIPKPAYCIWDNSEDDEFGKKQRYQAVVCLYSVPELFEAYPNLKNDPKKKAEIEALAANVSVLGGVGGVNYNTFFTGTALQWITVSNGVPLLTVVKAKYQSLDDKGKVCWYQSDLIGNKFIENAGEYKNQRLDRFGNVLPPFIDYIPDMQYGFNRSDLHRMIDIADEIKGMEAKIKKLVINAKGKIPVFMTSKLVQGMDVQRLLLDISMGVVVLNGTDIDQMSEAGKDPRFSFMLDFAADAQGIMAFRAEIDQKKNQMRNIASTSLLALGTQQTETGKGVQDRSIEQATFGQLPLTHGFTQWINEVLNSVAQIRKNLIYLQKDNERETLQISKRQYKVFEIIKEFSNAELSLYITDSDELDEGKKALMMTIFEREAQIPENYVDSAVVAEAMQCNTVTEMVNLLNAKKKSWTRKREQAAAAAAKQAAIDQQENRITQENMTDKQGQVKLADTAMKVDGKLQEQQNQIIADSLMNEPQK